MSAWPEPVERVSSVLRAAAIDARIEEFPSGTRTAREAARAVGAERAQIVKSLVLVCDGSYVLALVPGDGRVDERAVADAVPATYVRIARPEEVVEATGFEPGGVAPFPRGASSHVLIDRSLLRHDLVWIGAGTDSHMAALAPADLQRLAGARAFDLVARG
ncbi:MAG: aminoacyl-tRNA deacylase [Gaiellaceae bacterium]